MDDALVELIAEKRREFDGHFAVDTSLRRMEAAVACPRDGHSWWSVMGVRVCGRCGTKGA